MASTDNQVMRTEAASNKNGFETRMQNCLKFLYTAARLATEIKGLEEKYVSLTKIKNSLAADPHKATTVGTMNATIKELENKIASRKTEQKAMEDKVVVGFEKIFIAGFEGGFENLNGKIKEVEDRTNEQKLAAATQAKVMEQLGIKVRQHLKEIKDLQQLASKELAANLSEQITGMVEKKLATQMGPENIQKIIASLPEYQALKQLSQQQQESQTAAAAAAAAAEAQDASGFKALKKYVVSLNSQVTELKQSAQATRAIVDSMRETSVAGYNNSNGTLVASATTTTTTAALATTTNNNNNVDQQAAVKHVEQMEKEIQLIYNNIKMLETTINVKTLQAKENTAELSDGNARKRQRLEATPASEVAAINTTNATDATSSDNYNTLLTRLTNVEEEHQKFLDFIFQCRDTVLDEKFPDRLDASMRKIERILLNHETFIAFLMDPFATASSCLQKPSITDTDNTPTIETLGTLSPAMLDAISQVVKKTAEEVSLPLQKKIEQLEKKIESRQLQQ